MNDEHIDNFDNVESSFTELFSLLKCYETSPNGTINLVYESHDLKAIHWHLDNALAVLMQGLRNMGYLIGKISSNKKNIKEINNLGFFISAVSNLTEALNDLRTDTDQALRERGVMHY